jgi:hypothetical protein
MDLEVSTTECERSFSTLRREKTYLRSTMGEQKLNTSALLNMHQDRYVNPIKVADIFINSGRHSMHIMQCRFRFLFLLGRFYKMAVNQSLGKPITKLTAHPFQEFA